MKKSKFRIFINGVLQENPLLVMMLGVCPALAMTSSASSALTMGIVTSIVLICTNIMSSGLKRMVPESIRIPVTMALIAGLVCVMEYILHAYFPMAYSRLGVYTSLVSVNCLILGRTEAFARKNSIVNSAFDGLGMGVGYTMALVIIGMIRELLGAGTLFGAAIMPDKVVPMQVFTLAPGAFAALAFVAAVMNKILKGRNREKYINKCEYCPSAGICNQNKCDKGGKR